MRYFLAFAVITIATTASGQTFSVGALGGVPITDTTGSTGESQPYIVGGSFEVRIPASGFALEADALYRRVGDTNYASYITGSVSTFSASNYSFDRQRGNSWEFPLLGKYYFRRTSAWQPFVGAGFAFRTIGVSGAGNVTTSNSTGTLQTIPFPGSFREPLEVGATVAAGLRFHYSRMAILPQIRYTRWGGTNSLTRNNETAFLLGVTF